MQAPVHASGGGERGAAGSHAEYGWSVVLAVSQCAQAGGRGVAADILCDDGNACRRRRRGAAQLAHNVLMGSVNMCRWWRWPRRHWSAGLTAKHHAGQLMWCWRGGAPGPQCAQEGGGGRARRMIRSVLMVKRRCRQRRRGWSTGADGQASCRAASVVLVGPVRLLRNVLKSKHQAVLASTAWLVRSVLMGKRAHASGGCGRGVTGPRAGVGRWGWSTMC